MTTFVGGALTERMCGTDTVSVTATLPILAACRVETNAHDIRPRPQKHDSHGPGGHCHSGGHWNSCSLYLRGQFVVCKATAEPEVVCPSGSSYGTSDAGRDYGRGSRG